MRLKDKVALITGAGSGIGRESALLFSKEGAAILVVDVNDPAGNETVALVKQAGGRAAGIRARRPRRRRRRARPGAGAAGASRPGRGVAAVGPPDRRRVVAGRGGRHGAVARRRRAGRLVDAVHRRRPVAAKLAAPVMMIVLGRIRKCRAGTTA